MHHRSLQASLGCARNHGVATTAGSQQPLTVASRDTTAVTTLSAGCTEAGVIRVDEVVVSSSSALRALSGVRACAQLAPPRLLHARRAVPAGLVDVLWRDTTLHARAGLLRPARRRLSLASLPSENGPEEAHVSACIPPLSIVNSPVF